LFLSFLELEFDSIRVLKGVGDLLFPLLDRGKNVFEGKLPYYKGDNQEIDCLGDEHGPIDPKGVNDPLCGISKAG